MPADTYQINALGDGALLVSFGNVIDDELNNKVLALFERVQSSSLTLKDCVPAYSSLAIYYDPLLFRTDGKTAFQTVKKTIVQMLSDLQVDVWQTAKQWRLPVCYEQKFAPDLQALAQQKSMTTDEVVQLHTATAYRVYTLGFLPGFAYMGKVDERIATPRKNSPVTVAAGSVGIAGEQTGIYPFDSPGGWNIIGRTPVKLFKKEQAAPVLLQPGDEISFYSITEDEFANYKSGPA